MRTAPLLLDHTPSAQTRQPLPQHVALARGLLGWFVMCAGLGIAIGVPAALYQHFGFPRIIVMALQAILMSAIVIPLIMLLRTRLDRRSLAGLGGGRPVRAMES